MTTDVGIGTDGHVMAFALAGTAPAVMPSASQHFTIQFNQVVPPPFCASGPADFLLVQGPVTVDQVVSARSDGHVQGTQQQTLIAAALPDAGSLMNRINVDPEKEPKYRRQVNCH